MNQPANNTNYAIELEPESSSGTAVTESAEGGKQVRGSKVINFLRRAAQRRQVVDDERLTARYMVTRGRSTNVYSSLNNPDVPIITQHILGAVTTKIVAHNNSQQTAKDLVRIAQNSGWKTIKLSGSKNFKREAWLQASFDGLDVRGFKPDEQDRSNLLQMRLRVSANANTVVKATEAFTEHLKTDARMAGISLKDKESIEALFRSRLADMSAEGAITFNDPTLNASVAPTPAHEKTQEKVLSESPLQKIPTDDVLQGSMTAALAANMGDQQVGSTSSSQSQYESLVAGAIAQEMPTQSKVTVPKVKAKAVPEVKPKAVSEVKAKAMPEVKPKTVPKVKPKAVPKVKPKAVPEVKPKAVPEVKPKTVPKTKAVTKTADKKRAKSRGAAPTQ